MRSDMEGRIALEEEVATDLGFSNVFELRRWQTEMGSKVMELEHQLYTAQSDAESFRWHGRRQQVLLEKIDDVLKQLQAGNIPGKELLDKLRLGIAVTTGKGVDWNHNLKDWLF